MELNKPVTLIRSKSRKLAIIRGAKSQFCEVSSNFFAKTGKYRLNYLNYHPSSLTQVAPSFTVSGSLTTF